MIYVDEIGALFGKAVCDESGRVAVQPSKLAGWHVNTSEAIPSWKSKLTFPKTPKRVFGATTSLFCYVFSSRHEYLLAAKEAKLEDAFANKNNKEWLAAEDSAEIMLKKALVAQEAKS